MRKFPQNMLPGDCVSSEILRPYKYWELTSIIAIISTIIGQLY